MILDGAMMKSFAGSLQILVIRWYLIASWRSVLEFELQLFRLPIKKKTTRIYNYRMERASKYAFWYPLAIKSLPMCVWHWCGR